MREEHAVRVREVLSGAIAAAAMMLILYMATSEGTSSGPGIFTTFFLSISVVAFAALAIGRLREKIPSQVSVLMEVRCRVDGRWIAVACDYPGVSADGSTK